MSGSIVIRARWILPSATAALENGWVAIDRGRIVALGRRERPAGAVDLGDAVILPGLVNAHTHLEFSDIPAPLDASGGLPGWISRVVGLRRARPTGVGESHRLRAALQAGLEESLRHGVTTLGDVATAVPHGGYPSPGPRVRMFREALGLAFEGRHPPGAVCRDLDRFGPLAGISPHAAHTVSAPLGRALLDEAARRRLPATMHLAESREELAFVADGDGPFRDLFARLGAWPADRRAALLPPSHWIGRLARLPRASVVHGTFLGEHPDDGALERLARHRDRVALIVCPRTCRHLSGVLPPVRRFLDAGIRVAIGTDGRGSNPDLSPLAEARTLVSAGVVGPREAFRMVTLDAAWALWLEGVAGRIAAGRGADLVVVRPDVLRGDPWEAILDPGAGVEAVLRRGRLLHGGLDRRAPTATAGSSRSGSR